MPRTTNSKINTFFSFSTGSWLDWSDEQPAKQQEQENETEDSQSIDSDHSSDFFFNFSPEVEHQIIKNRATYLTQLEENIKKTTKQVNTKIEQKRFEFQINELLLLESILEFTTPKLLEQLAPKKKPTAELQERLEKLEIEIETKLAETKKESTKTTKGPFVTFGSSRSTQTERSQDASGRSQATNKSHHSTPGASTPEFRPELETTFWWSTSMSKTMGSRSSQTTLKNTANQTH